MGNVNKAPQSTQTAPLKKLPVPPQTKPISASTNPATAKILAAAPVAQDLSKINLSPAQKGAALSRLSFLTPLAMFQPTLPPLLKTDDKSETVAELNKLLTDLGLLKANPGKVYSTETMNVIVNFQINNHLPMTGLVDENTLLKLIDSAKEDEATYPLLEALVKQDEDDDNDAPTGKIEPVLAPLTVAPRTYANEAERVKDLIAIQLGTKGIDTEKAFAIGGNLLDAQIKQDRRMGSSSMCYTAVKTAIQDAMNIPYMNFRHLKGGSSAKNSVKYMFPKTPEFVKIEDLKRADLPHLPPGAVIVYKPTKGHGHIGVQNGKGLDISDKSRTQANVHKSAAFEVYYPVAVREKK